MAYITAGSEPSMLSESQLFYVPPTITERVATHDVLIGPSAATFDDAVDITFDIAPSNDLISLSDMRFQCDLVVRKGDGAPFDLTDNACPCNNILSTLFQSVQVTLAGRSISDPSNLYFIRSYLENLLGYTETAIKSQLTCEGFFLDSTQDNTNMKGAYVAANGAVPALNQFRNQDQISRFDLIKKGTAVQLSGRIHCDLFQQHKPLLPEVSLSLKFIRSRTALAFTALTADRLPKVAIRNPKLFVRKYEPTTSYINVLQRDLLRSPAVYHFERVQMRQMTVNTGQQFAEWPNLVTGQLPKMMLLTMTSSKALSGSYDTTPFYFDNFDLMLLSAEIDGKIYPSNGMEMDYSNGYSLSAYEGLCRVLEVFNDTERALPFDRNQFAKGFTIYGFDFTPSGTSRGALTLIKQGNLNLALKFKNPVAEPIVLLAYLVFDSTISINNQRQAIFDFQA